MTDGATQQYERDTPDEEKWCSICNKTEEEIGFELNQTHDGEWICEDCEDASIEEEEE